MALKAHFPKWLRRLLRDDSGVQQTHDALEESFTEVEADLAAADADTVIDEASEEGLLRWGEDLNEPLLPGQTWDQYRATLKAIKQGLGVNGDGLEFLLDTWGIPYQMYEYGDAESFWDSGFYDDQVVSVPNRQIQVQFADPYGSDELYRTDFTVDDSGKFVAHGPGSWVWDAENGQLEGHQSIGGPSEYLINGLVLGDARVRATFSQARSGGLIVRYIDHDNYYFALLSDDSGTNASTNVELWKRVGGVETYLASAANQSWPRGESAVIELAVTDTTLEASFNGVLVASRTDSALSGAGQVGIRHNTSSATEHTIVHAFSVNPISPLFSRTSPAYGPYDGAKYASGEPRFVTVSGHTGILVEEWVVNHFVNPDFEGVGFGGWIYYDFVTGQAHGADFAGCQLTSAAAFAGTQSMLINNTNNGFMYQNRGIKSGAFSLAFIVRKVDGSPVTSSEVKAVPNNGTVSFDSITHLRDGWYLCVKNNQGFANANWGIWVAANVAVYVDCGMYYPGQYVTSFTPTTRAEENLVIRTPGVLTPDAGFISIAFWADGELIQPTQSRYYALAECRVPNATQRMVSLSRTTAGDLRLDMGDDTGGFTSMSPDAPLTKGLHIATAAWGADSLAVWLDGAKLYEAIGNIHKPTSFFERLYIGNWVSWGRALNQPIFGLRLGMELPADSELRSITPETGLPATITGQSVSLDFTQGVMPYLGPDPADVAASKQALLNAVTQANRFKGRGVQVTSVVPFRLS